MAKKKVSAKVRGKKTQITANMTVGEVIRKWPAAAQVFFKHGMPCVGCAIASSETVGQAASAHGIDVKNLLVDLNKVAKAK